MQRRARVPASLSALLVTAALVGCSDSDPATTPPAQAAVDYTALTSEDPVTTGGFVWSSDETVHLSDGTTIDTGGPVRAYVVAGDGVYFFPATSEDEIASFNGGIEEVMFARPGGDITGTGWEVYIQDLAASPDGRYLTALDTTSGEKDRFGTPQASVVAFDLTTGEQVLNSVEGMGDPATEDFADGYSESEIAVQEVTNDHVRVRASDGEFLYDFTTGDVSPAPEINRDRPEDPFISPSGDWQIMRSDNLRDTLAPRTGQPVTPAPGTDHWGLDFWADGQTAIGTAISGPVEAGKIGPESTLNLMTCTVPSGRCEVFEDTAGRTIVYPRRAYDSGGVILNDGGREE